MYIFGFDFSISKPAMCFYDTNTSDMKFVCWPQKVDNKTYQILSEADVKVFNRNLCPISKATFTDNISMVREHTKRAAELSELIIMSIFDILDYYDCTNRNDVYITSEGLSFASTGNAALDLSGYKYTLLTTLYKRGIRNIYTYSPISIKNIAGCSKKDQWTKTFMIDAIKKEEPYHKFIETLKNHEDDLKKKSAYVPCVDDLVDSYWAMRTFIEKDMKNV